MLRKNFINKKVELIEDDLSRLAEFKNYSFDEIASDFYKYSVVERLLEKIIMRAIDINQHIIVELSKGEEKSPSNYEETFLELAKLKIYPQKFAQKISKSAGLRNALVHDYNDVNKKKLYGSIEKALIQYHRYCDYILKFLKNLKL